MIARHRLPDRRRPNNFEFQAANRARRQFLVHALYRLGKYPLFHFIAEIERGGSFNETIEIYGELDADVIAALGGRDFPLSVHSVDGSAP